MVAVVKIAIEIVSIVIEAIVSTAVVSATERVIKVIVLVALVTTEVVTTVITTEVVVIREVSNTSPSIRETIRVATREAVCPLVNLTTPIPPTVVVETSVETIPVSILATPEETSGTTIPSNPILAAASLVAFLADASKQLKPRKVNFYKQFVSCI